MRNALFILLLGCGLWAQAQNPGSPAASSSKPQDSTASTNSKAAPAPAPNLTPPHSGTVNADSLGDAAGESSSKDTQIDLSPPADDDKTHPRSSEVLADEGSGDTGEVHVWDPHKAAKDVEVGDYYFKRKNYAAAESRYREALLYKGNDAMATYRLAVCLEKMNRSEEARSGFESYLQILPNGPQAQDARKAIERLKGTVSTGKAELPAK